MPGYAKKAGTAHLKKARCPCFWPVKGNAATITAITALYPLITLLMAVLFLHETLTLRQGIGFFMAVTAVFLIAF